MLNKLLWYELYLHYNAVSVYIYVGIAVTQFPRQVWY
jgi:hypothetical protein